MLDKRGNVQMSEGLLWNRIRNHKPGDIWLQRIENMSVNGMPDVLAINMDQKHTWLELKYAHTPVRKTTPLLDRKSIRREQINWHLKAAGFGVKSFILVGTDKHQLFLLPGRMAAVAADMPYCDFLDYGIANYNDLWRYIK